MNAEHAEHTLVTIRTLMERSQRYQHISGYSGLVAGGCVWVGCALLWSGRLPWSHEANFAVVWGTVFLVAFGIHCLLTFKRARHRGEPVWSRQARTVAMAILPGFVASVVMSVVLTRAGLVDVVPGVWLLLYGCGTLATSFFAPHSIRWLGIVCLTLGAASLLVYPGHPVLTMAVGFGLTHVAHGICVLVGEWREERARREFAELLHFEETGI
jgi:hypothetical protein